MARGFLKRSSSPGNAGGYFHGANGDGVLAKAGEGDTRAGRESFHQVRLQSFMDCAGQYFANRR
jgi:hypothetical protein